MFELIRKQSQTFHRTFADSAEKIFAKKIAEKIFPKKMATSAKKISAALAKEKIHEKKFTKNF